MVVVVVVDGGGVAVVSSLLGHGELKRRSPGWCMLQLDQALLRDLLEHLWAIPRRVCHVRVELLRGLGVIEGHGRGENLVCGSVC